LAPALLVQLRSPSHPSFRFPPRFIPDGSRLVCLPRTASRARHRHDLQGLQSDGAWRAPVVAGQSNAPDADASASNPARTPEIRPSPPARRGPRTCGRTAASQRFARASAAIDPSTYSPSRRSARTAKWSEGKVLRGFTSRMWCFCMRQFGSTRTPSMHPRPIPYQLEGRLADPPRAVHQSGVEEEPPASGRTAMRGSRR